MTDQQDPHAPHLGLETISDLDEGLLSPDEAQAAREHLAACELCTDDQAALAAVRQALGDDHDLAMPDDVSDRIHGALAALPPFTADPTGPDDGTPDEASRPVGASVTTLPQPRGRTTWDRMNRPARAWLGAAAGVALIVLGITHLPNGSSSDKSAAPAAAATTGSVTVTHSGLDYNATTLGAQGLNLLRTGAAAGATSAAALTSAAAAPAATSGAAAATAGAAAVASSAAGSAASAPSPAAGGSARSPAGAPDLTSGGTGSGVTTAGPAPTTDALAALRPDGAAQACLSSLLPGAGPPLAIDFGTYNGKPAVIGVFQDAGNGTRVQVVAAGPPGCVLYSFARVPKP